MTTDEVAAYLDRSRGLVLPTGSIEQHAALGLLGTDALCAGHIARGAGELADAIVAPTLSYAPAQFNMAFAGTVSISCRVFSLLFIDIINAFQRQGFRHIYVLNAHGANLAPLQSSVHDIYAESGDHSPLVRIKNWWDFDTVNRLRDAFYGEKEGLHATPSEVAITQFTDRVVTPKQRAGYRALSQQTIRDHRGDQHLPADLHRRQFPDGQVGSDPSLATPQHGEQLLQAASRAVAEDYLRFLQS